MVNTFYFGDFAYMKKLWQFINRDVKFEDEASQFFVMMRIYYLITGGYIVVYDLLALWSGIWREMPILLVWLPLHILSFFSTYRYRRRVVFHMFSMGILIWMILAVYYMGWDYGAQYFMYPLIVISFFATYRNFIGKAVYVFSLTLLHLAMFFYCKGFEPVVALSKNLSYMFQFLNVIVLFLCMYVICLVFSNSNQAALEKLADYNERLKQEAITDALTGMLNRRCMYEQLEDIIKNHQNSIFTVAMGDIDFFKKINDNKGHDCGDEVLREIAAYLKTYMKGKGTVCRWGGEEFFFLFPDNNGDEAFTYVSDMKQHIEKMDIMYEDKPVSVTMTFGVEEYNVSNTLTELIKRVDDKLYLGKEQGRNRVIY